MEKKLELKHLAPYLPYGLKMTRNGFVGELVTIKIGGDKSPCDFKVTCSPWWESIEDNNHYKPILRPLSDLEDNHCYVDQMKEDVNHSISFQNGLFSDLTADDFDIKWLPQVSFNWLVKNHFDVFSLIPDGLAISYKEAGI